MQINLHYVKIRCMGIHLVWETQALKAVLCGVVAVALLAELEVDFHRPILQAHPVQSDHLLVPSEFSRRHLPDHILNADITAYRGVEKLQT